MNRFLNFISFYDFFQIDKMKRKQNLEKDLLVGSDHEDFIEPTIHDYDEDGSNDVKLQN